MSHRPPEPSDWPAALGYIFSLTPVTVKVFWSSSTTRAGDTCPTVTNTLLSSGEAALLVGLLRLHFGSFSLKPSLSPWPPALSLTCKQSQRPQRASQQPTIEVILGDTGLATLTGKLRFLAQKKRRKNTFVPKVQAAHMHGYISSKTLCKTTTGTLIATLASHQGGGQGQGTRCPSSGHVPICSFTVPGRPQTAICTSLPSLVDPPCPWQDARG